MKLSFIITSLTSGGAEHQLTTLCNLLADYDFDIEIVTFADLPDHYELDKRVRRVRLAPMKGKLKKMLAIYNYTIRQKSDLVFAFGHREALFVTGALALKRTKFIIGERNINFTSPGILKKQLDRFAFWRASFIVSNSHTQKRLICEKNSGLRDKVRVITNYTDIEKYTLKNYPNKGKRKICVFARFSEQKNYLNFAKAVLIVKNQYGNNFQIDWYGRIHSKDGSLIKGYVVLNQFLKDNSLGDVFRLNDSITEVDSTIQNYHALCLPSLFEGFSNSISEAICCGRPVLASNVSDNPIMVNDDINGFLFNPNDVSDIANKILLFLNCHEEKLKEMSINSIRLSKTLFDKEKFVKSYIDIFSECTNK